MEITRDSSRIGGLTMIRAAGCGYALFFIIGNELLTRVSMEVSNSLVSWVLTYLGHLQPTYIWGYNPVTNNLS